MSWIRKIFGRDEQAPNKPPVTAGGLPAWRQGLDGKHLDSMNLSVTNGSETKEFRVGELRRLFLRGLLPGDARVVATNFYCEQTYYCDESNVSGIVSLWQTTPLSEFDQKRTGEMIEEFQLPPHQVRSKADYDDLKQLYDQCDRYYRLIASKDKQFKRLTKLQAKDIVLLLNERTPGWDDSDGKDNFIEAAVAQHPNLKRTEAEKRVKKQREKIRLAEHEEKKPLIQTRNSLTDFPNKNLVVEVRDVGLIAIKELKEKLRDGIVSPESQVRLPKKQEWMELCEFLNDWVKNKASSAQLSYLLALQRQHDIADSIAEDISRTEASERIGRLAPKRDEQGNFIE